MRRDNNHNLLIWLLALMVVFAPMQAAVSSIEMLLPHKGQAPHCQMEMADHVDHGSMGHGDCCQHDGDCQGNCASCAQCISAHAALFGQTALQDQARHQFIQQKTSLAKGIPGGSAFRPPRLLS